MMDPLPPAIVQPAGETESEFRRWVRDEFMHLRELMQHNSAALELILKALKVDEERHGEDAHVG